MRNKYLLESEIKYSKQERKAFLESIKEFSQFRKEIFRETGMMNEKSRRPLRFSERLSQIKSRVAELIESAEAFTLQETQDGFDQISVNRDLKEIKTDYKMFEKTCNEMTQLQQRLEACYENIGTKLGRYYEL